jgi:hypothetical protein
MEREFLDEIIAKRAARNPEIPKLVDAALQRRRQERRQKPAQVVAMPAGTRHAAHTPPLAGKKDELTAV